ncbi:DUF3991 domain-containing protein [Gluconobacter sp. Dm-44]|uniref:DUF3991 domain-containing protein n=1 Tax=Gluconobacter sp. Dm-44 TaxID=2799805 RepID=UPI001B8CC52C|nr:DUF3991 domain-containing protein [Gluconobacter sp. Dm-44]MBS1061150.1 DUF3991 domain-containing protein [Gluconobacter sp. Dm-44]
MDDRAEIEYLRDHVDCRVLLERHGFTLYPQESSRHVWKYVRKSGPAGHQIVIVNNHGKGWFAPLDTGTKGDVFTLAQYLEPGANFGQARVILRPFAGLSPQLPLAVRASAVRDAAGILPDRWHSRSAVSSGSQTWRYLTGQRAIPAKTVRRAAEGLYIKEGPYGTMWAAHTAEGRSVTGWEMRGPTMASAFSKGGDKALFHFAWTNAGSYTRLVVAEAAIDAMSIATIECTRSDTLYVSTGGGLGPLTMSEIRRLSRGVQEIGTATDANAAGDRYACMIADLADVPAVRIRPAATDWNAQLMNG